MARSRYMRSGDGRRRSAGRITRGFALKQRRRRAKFYRRLWFSRTATRRKMSVEQRPITKGEGLAAIVSVLVLACWYSLQHRLGVLKALPLITAPLNVFVRARP